MDLSSIHPETQLNAHSSSSSKRLVPDHLTNSNPRPWVILCLKWTKTISGFDSNPRPWVIPPNLSLGRANPSDSNPRPWVILLVYLLVLVGGPDSNPRLWVIHDRAFSLAGRSPTPRLGVEVPVTCRLRLRHLHLRQTRFGSVQVAGNRLRPFQTHRYRSHRR